MSPPVVAQYKIHVEGNEQINCTPNGGGGRFWARTTLSFASQDGIPYTLEFFVWDGIKQTSKPDWPFVEAPPIPPNKAPVPSKGPPFQGTLKPTESGSEGVYAYSISADGYRTLDPIIVVDN